MNFSHLHERLRIEIWRRIERGVVSGKLLAAQTGLRSSHISNFLHRKRNLSLKAIDRLMTAQQIAVQQLIDYENSETGGPAMRACAGESIPIVSPTMAIHHAVIVPSRQQRSFILPPGELDRFPSRPAASRRGWQRFVALRVSAQQAAPMAPLLSELSIVILDRHYNSLIPVNPPSPNLYAVRVGNSLLFRYASFEGSRLLLRPRLFQFPIEAIELSPYENPSDLLIGRVCFCLTET